MKPKRAQLVSMLEAATREAGSGNPIGITPWFWSDMRRDMLHEDPEVTQATQMEVLSTGKVGTWRGVDLFLIPSRARKGEDEPPRPWRPEHGDRYD